MHKLTTAPEKTFLVALMSLTLVSCGAIQADNKEEKPSATASAGKKDEEEKRESLVLPPQISGANTSTSQTGGAPTGGLESLKGLKGVNIESLFSEKLKDDEARFKRLENAFLDLHRQFKTLEPAIIRLVAIEEDINNLTNLLSAELGVIEQTAEEEAINPLQEEDIALEPQKIANVQQEAIPPKVPTPVTSKPAASVETPKVKAAQKPSVIAKVKRSISGIRVGQHPNFTRVVLDAQEDMNYETAFDETFKRFTIKLPAQWNGQNRKDFASHPLLSHYSIDTSQEDGSATIHLHFKVPVTLSHKESLKQKTAPVLRMLFDFKVKS